MVDLSRRVGPEQVVRQLEASSLRCFGARQQERRFGAHSQRLDMTRLLAIVTDEVDMSMRTRMREHAVMAV